MPIQNIQGIQRIAKQMEPDIARAFLRTIQQIKDATAISRIEAAIRRRDMAGVLNAIPLQEFEKQFQSDIARTIRDVAEGGAEVAVLPGGITASLNVTNPEVFDFIREATLNPILKIRAESENAIRDSLFKAFTEGVHPYDMARQIREIVGLTANQWETVDRYRLYFEELAGRGAGELGKTALYKIGRGGMARSANVIARQGLTKDRIDKLVANYTDRLIRERAEGIARTLTIDASNAGQGALWTQAVSDGLLRPEEWEVCWIVAHDDRLCPRCRGMETMRRDINGVYPNGIARPTLHPNCRCSEGLVRKVRGLRLPIMKVA
ncbi:MAG: hypothetical protein LAP85_15035 [Acidobacteriia bacterium]|nr:hypothetical protein [Terriglobia bacterium]